MKNEKYYFYYITTAIFGTGANGKEFKEEASTTMHMKTQNISLPILEQTRDALTKMAQEVCERNGHKLKNLEIVSISPLGYMTVEEFTGKSEDEVHE